MKCAPLGVRVLLAALFIAAGVAKLSDLPGFVEVLERFEVFPKATLPWLARFVPWFEIVAGLALLTPWLCWGGWWLLFGFTLLATAALIQAYFRELAVDCGCWGAWWEISVEMALVRNSVLLGLFVISYTREESRA